jgi:predicted ATPase/class 3 adenylate cyclase
LAHHDAVRRELPSGTVTFLFTDVEGSTKLLHGLGTDAYAEALAEHRRILRTAFSAHGGVEVDTQGDAFFIAFPTAPGALRAAADAVAGLTPGPIRVRVGIHTGTPHTAAEGYVGVDVHRAARIAACGHGGQVLVSASTAALVGTEGLRDLGEHRLKDLSAPERIYQLGDEEFPRLKSLHQTNLPIPSTPFFGREHELSEVLGLLSREDTRLLTLTGPGGTGKTRLGLQAAGGVADRHENGVWWVPLASLRDPDLVLETAGQILGAKNGLAQHIGEKSMLLLFDNFEHVVDAATGLSDVLAACPNLRLLVTSRELLRIPGEQAYSVPPLEPQEGTEFFVARAHATLPGFVPSPAVSELCARLENLPLALELAAARIRILSPEQLLERLSLRLDMLKGGRGVDPRQQTLRATIEWSYDLLGHEEQRLFARLAIFAGGCTVETAETICEADLDTLQALVDKSLVRIREGERFWMLETIREYAAERLEASDEAEPLRRRHAEHFLALAEEAEPHLPAYRREWLEQLEHEHDNLRAALDWLETAGETQLALRLAGALSRFWLLRGHLAEGARRLETALRADARPTAARAKALAGASMLSHDDATSKLRAEQALALHRTLGDEWGIAQSELVLAWAVAGEDMVRAQQLYDRSARRFTEAGDDHSALIATRSLAWACINLGERERGRALHEENLRRARALSNERIEAITLGALAMHALEEGEVDDAVSMLKESHRLHSGLGDPIQTALDVFRFAALLAAKGRAVSAAKVFSSSEALCEEIGFGLHGWDPEFVEGTLTSIRAQLDEAAFTEAWEKGRRLTADDAAALALESLEASPAA